MAMQTNWKYPKNAAVQCAPREFSDEAKAEIESSPAFAEFLNNVAPRFVGFITVGLKIINDNLCYDKSMIAMP